MDSCEAEKKPHAVFLNFPMASQINPMLELAKILYSNGFYITFIITDSIHRRLLRSTSCEELKGTKCFRFEIIPDGLSPDTVMMLNARDLFPRMKKTFADPFSRLLEKLNSSSDVPPVTCIVADLLMTFTVDVAEIFDIPLFVFWTCSAAYLLGSLYVPELIRRGYIPLKDESCLTNGYLDSVIDWIPGMKNIHLRNLSSFIRTTDRNSVMLNILLAEVSQVLRATGIIFNTLDQLETEVLDAIKQFIPRSYAIGPLSLLANLFEGYPKNLRLSVWKQATEDCKLWLDTQKDASIVYVSFGSLATLTTEQLAEFAWGLADSNLPFLWVFRADLVKGGLAALPMDFEKQTQGRGFICSWCDQREVLSHPAIGAFLTHAGWNSITESICAGLPMICWPEHCDQFTNSHYVCEEFRVGVEIDEEVKREEVKELVRKVMEGSSNQELKKNAMKWKAIAEDACKGGGSSLANLNRLIKDLNS